MEHFNAFPEFAEDYEPSHNEILAQAGRRLRFNDRSTPNSTLGLTRIPFDDGWTEPNPGSPAESDGTTIGVEFYKPEVYEHNGIPYSVVLSTVVRHYHGGDENAPSDVIVYLMLDHPNEEGIRDASFTITDYSGENQVVGELVFHEYDDIVDDNRAESRMLFNILYYYGMDGFAVKGY
jgi:hypothetical protein